jgi:phosphomannomutase
MQPVYQGSIPTPALTSYAIARRRGSMMITGGHIPFDRNGYKTNTALGELLKRHEAPIGDVVREVRARVYATPYDASPFNEQGLFKSGHAELPAPSSAARDEYIERYTRFFAGETLAGARLLVYQHSAVGRDLLVEVLRRLGADAIPVGRSDTFVPIDTEAIDDAQLATMQALCDEATAGHEPPFAIVSTDGDSDRPLILGVDAATGKVRFFAGDLVGMVTAEYLSADAVVVPISCNDGIDHGALASALQPKTRIGSPYVIAGMDAARATKKVVCGWEANGGFLTGSEIVRNGRALSALPTRDAVLPILCVLFSARQQGVTLAGLFSRLPARFSRAALLRQFPRAVGLRIVERFSPADPAVQEVSFTPAPASAPDLAPAEWTRVHDIRHELESFFTAALGFAPIARLNYVDGVRIVFENGDVAHLRPSGNADEFRIYAVAGTPERAEEITRRGVAEPDGILRRIERAVRG